MNEKNRRGIRAFGRWLSLFLCALAVVASCAGSINYASAGGGGFYAAAGLAALALGGWRIYVRARELMGEE